MHTGLGLQTDLIGYFGCFTGFGLFLTTTATVTVALMTLMTLMTLGFAFGFAFAATLTMTLPVNFAFKAALIQPDRTNRDVYCLLRAACHGLSAK